MAAYKHSRTSAIAARLKRIWSELGYANRRMFEIRTGERFVDDHRQSFVEDHQQSASRSRVAGRGPVPVR